MSQHGNVPEIGGKYDSINLRCLDGVAPPASP